MSRVTVVGKIYWISRISLAVMQNVKTYAVIFTVYVTCYIILSFSSPFQKQN